MFVWLWSKSQKDHAPSFANHFPMIENVMRSRKDLKEHSYGLRTDEKTTADNPKMDYY